MTLISDDDVTAFTRSLIGEGTAKHWTDVEIALYIEMAMMKVNTKYWHLLAPTETQVEAIDLAASTDNVSLPDDCAKVLRVEVAETRKLLRKIEVDEVWKYSPYDDGVAATGYLNIWFLEYYDATTDFPEALRPLIAIEAAIMAKTKDTGAVDAGILNLRREFGETAIAFLSTDSMYEPTVFGDSELEEGYTRDNPCAWAFKENKIYLYKTYEEG